MVEYGAISCSPELQCADVLFKNRSAAIRAKRKGRYLAGNGRPLTIFWYTQPSPTISESDPYEAPDEDGSGKEVDSWYLWCQQACWKIKTLQVKDKYHQSSNIDVSKLCSRSSSPEGEGDVANLLKTLSYAYKRYSHCSHRNNHVCPVLVVWCQYDRISFCGCGVNMISFE